MDDSDMKIVKELHNLVVHIQGIEEILRRPTVLKEIVPALRDMTVRVRAIGDTLQRLTVLAEEAIGTLDTPPIDEDRPLQVLWTLRTGADLVLKGDELPPGVLESIMPDEYAATFDEGKDEQARQARSTYHAITVLHTAAQFGTGESPRVLDARRVLLAAIERGEL